MEIYLILLAINMAIGIALFEWAWKKVKPIREINEERDS